MSMSTPDDILQFWFGGSALHTEPPEGSMQRWFMGGAVLDDEIRRRFADTHQRAASGALDSWKETLQGRLALLIVLDQFSRNLHRGDARAFACDPAALALSRSMIAAGDDAAMGFWQKLFAYTALEHAEDLGPQRHCVVLMARMLTSAPPELRGAAENVLGYALSHHDIIERFGRFPHRNPALGRADTPEEAAWLKAGGPAFGQESREE